MDYTDKRQDLFVELYCEHEPHIRAFLRSLLPTNTDVDEVLQEVSVVIWKKFDRFDESTDFMRWVYVIARLEALKYRRKHARSRLIFDDAVYNLMAEEGKDEHPKRKLELTALQKCLSNLPEKQRELIDTIYQHRIKAVDLAEKDFQGLVVGNQAANFSVGANIGMIFMMAVEQEYDELNMAVKMFQDTMMRMRYSSIPTIAAPHGMCLGGGCELSLHADKVVAAAETYDVKLFH